VVTNGSQDIKMNRSNARNVNLITGIMNIKSKKQNNNNQKRKQYYAILRIQNSSAKAVRRDEEK
jgi:hypothetical protein